MYAESHWNHSDSYWDRGGRTCTSNKMAIFEASELSNYFVLRKKPSICYRMDNVLLINVINWKIYYNLPVW